MRVRFSSPVRSPSSSGTILSAIQLSQTPSSIASFTTPTALSSVAKACEKQSTATRNTACRSYPRHQHPPQIDSRPGLYRRVGDACQATIRVGDSHLDCRALPAVRSPCPNHSKPLAHYGAIEGALARGLPRSPAIATHRLPHMVTV